MTPQKIAKPISARILRALNIFVFSGLLVMGKHLLVAGGETTDQLGRTIILDSMETLVKKRWVPLRQKLPERRSRFSLIRIPRTYVN